MIRTVDGFYPHRYNRRKFFCAISNNYCYQQSTKPNKSGLAALTSIDLINYQHALALNYSNI